MKGILYIVLFILIISINGLCFKQLSEDLNSASLMFIMFAPVPIVGIIMNSFTVKGFLQKVIRYKKEIVFQNVYSAGCWFGYFLSLKYIEPALSVLIANIITPLFIFTSNRFLQNERVTWNKLLCIILLSICLTIALFDSYFAKESSITYLSGLFFAVLSGVTQGLYSIHTFGLRQTQLKPSEILSTRFILTGLLGLVFVDFQLVSAFAINDIRLTLYLFFSTFFPMYILLRGMLITPPIIVSLLLILEPIIMYIIEVFNKKITENSYTLIAIVISLPILIYAIFVNKNQR